jgi:DNA-directed RNA polymerase subunit RPC12/RpoP
VIRGGRNGAHRTAPEQEERAVFPFCPHCGHTLDQPQPVGKTVTCARCGHPIGVAFLQSKAEVIDPTEELIRRGEAARCPQCAQLVEVKTRPTGRALAPHYATAPSRRLCPGSGKELAAPPKATAGKDLSGYMTRDVIRVVVCGRDDDPRIEELTLEYLDKSDRVRLQIEALREILGTGFRMKDYPAPLRQPELAVWGNATACAIAKRHPQGGFQQPTDAEAAHILEDLRQNRPLFFA